MGGCSAAGAYEVEGPSRGDSPAGVIAAQARAQAALEALHVWIGAEESQTGGPRGGL